MIKRNVLIGAMGFGIALLIFYLLWDVLLGLSFVWPEHLSDWALFLSALIIPTVYAVAHEYEFGHYFFDSLKFIGLLLLSCIGANMIGFSLGALIEFIVAIIYQDYETIFTFVGLIATIAFIGAPGGGLTIWVFVID